MTDCAPRKIEADLEYARRFPWWFWLPEVEREQFAQAESDDDGKVLMMLKRRGRLREEFEASENCYHGNEPCDCLVRALDSRSLIAFLRKRPPRGGKSAVSYVAQEFHRNPEFTIKGWLVAMRERLRPKPPPAPEETIGDPPLPQPISLPEPEPAASEPEPTLRQRPVRHMRRWYEDDEGNLFDRRF